MGFVIGWPATWWGEAKSHPPCFNSMHVRKIKFCLSLGFALRIFCKDFDENILEKSRIKITLRKDLDD